MSDLDELENSEREKAAAKSIATKTTELAGLDKGNKIHSEEIIKRRPKGGYVEGKGFVNRVRFADDKPKTKT